jgi:HEAT repeat protein
MSTVPDKAPNRPDPPSRTTILVAALGGVATFALIILVVFRVLDRANQGLNNAAEEQRQRDEQNRRQLDRLLGAKQPAPDMKSRALADVEHADPAIRLESVAVISKLSLTDPQAIPALIKRLKRDTDARVRLAALRALRTIDPRPPAVAEALQSATKDNDPLVRAEAEAAVAKD